MDYAITERTVASCAANTRTGSPEPGGEKVEEGLTDNLALVEERRDLDSSLDARALLGARFAPNARDRLTDVGLSAGNVAKGRIE